MILLNVVLIWLLGKGWILLIQGDRLSWYRFLGTSWMLNKCPILAIWHLNPIVMVILSLHQLLCMLLLWVRVLLRLASALVSLLTRRLPLMATIIVVTTTIKLWLICRVNGWVHQAGTVVLNGLAELGLLASNCLVTVAAMIQTLSVLVTFHSHHIVVLHILCHSWCCSECIHVVVGV